MHNTMPEYRIGWFQEMQKLADVDFVFTNDGEYQKKYGLDMDKGTLENTTFLTAGWKGFHQLCGILGHIKKYDFIELPPVDTIHELLMSWVVCFLAHRHGVKLGYFWEKWEAPRNQQPIKRKIKNFLLGRAAWSVYRQADVLFAGSSMTKDYFISYGIDSDLITVIPEASECPSAPYVDIREKYDIPADKILLLYFGRIMPEKGPDVLLKAYAELNSTGEYYLLMAGDGDFLMNCRALAEQLQLSNIAFAGKVQPAMRANYFSQCDIFIFPATYYGGWVDVWGLTVNEAVQFGKPVISTPAVGSAREMIKQGLNGFIVESDDENAIWKAVINCSGSDYRKTCSDYDKKLLKKYSCKRMAEEYISFV